MDVPARPEHEPRDSRRGHIARAGRPVNRPPSGARASSLAAGFDLVLIMLPSILAHMERELPFGSPSWEPPRTSRRDGPSKKFVGLDGVHGRRVPGGLTHYLTHYGEASSGNGRTDRYAYYR
jgi:hypothetical protein